MTDRLSLMTNMEALVKAIDEDRERGKLQSAEAVQYFVRGWVKETRKAFDEDNKGGLYGA